MSTKISKHHRLNHSHNKPPNHKHQTQKTITQQPEKHQIFRTRQARDRRPKHASTIKLIDKSARIYDVHLISPNKTYPSAEAAVGRGHLFVHLSQLYCTESVWTCARTRSSTIDKARVESASFLPERRPLWPLVGFDKNASVKNGAEHRFTMIVIWAAVKVYACAAHKFGRRYLWNPKLYCRTRIRSRC